MAKLVELTPKNEAAKTKLGYHGTRWEIRDKIENLKFSSLPGPFFVLRSRDGKKVLFVKTEGDPDYSYRAL